VRISSRWHAAVCLFLEMSVFVWKKVAVLTGRSGHPRINNELTTLTSFYMSCRTRRHFVLPSTPPPNKNKGSTIKAVNLLHNKLSHRPSELGTAIQFQVDSFTETPFKGNPACVVVMPDRVQVSEQQQAWMQNVAAENNIPVTAFISGWNDATSNDSAIDIRWYSSFPV
jgi:hypothetical protein